MLLQAERRALEGARHVERAVAVLPAAVAERDHDLAFGHELAIEPGDALIAKLLLSYGIFSRVSASMASRPVEANMNYPSKVRVVEVGPRDGLQNEAKPVSVEAKVRLIDALSAAGHSAVEAGSFVSPQWVPHIANTDQVMARIQRNPGVSYPVLVPNKQGMNGAVEAECGEIAVFTAASEAFCRKNTNCSIDESFERFPPVLEAAPKHPIKVPA